MAPGALFSVLYLPGTGAQASLFDFRACWLSCFTAAFGTLHPALHRVRDSADHQVQRQVLTSVFGGKATGGRVDPGRGGMKTIVICSLPGPGELPGGGGWAREGRRGGRGEEGISKWLGGMVIPNSRVGTRREMTLFSNR